MARMRDAVATALTEETPSEETAPEAELTEGETPTTEASDGGPPEGTTDDVETTTETPEGTVEAPDEYFGLKLDGMEPEQRLAFIEELRKRDDYIGKLLRERSSDEPAAEAETPVTPDEVSDADILRALGLDPENNAFDEETAKVALPLAKNQLQMQGTLAALVEAQELAEIDRTWRQGLSAMEREFGSLPTELDHDRVMEFAADHDISNPMDAYWRIVGPGQSLTRAALETDKAKQAKLTAAKKAASTARPGGSTVEDEMPVAGTKVKDATKDVTRKLLSSLGLDV